MSLVAIVGRPNVGKSTLFNRLVGQRQAIVDETAGTTRDRHYGKTDWNGKELSVIDTGGYTVNSEDIFEDEIRRQVMLAIDEADLIQITKRAIPHSSKDALLPARKRICRHRCLQSAEESFMAQAVELY